MATERVCYETFYALDQMPETVYSALPGDVFAVKTEVQDPETTANLSFMGQSKEDTRVEVYRVPAWDRVSEAGHKFRGYICLSGQPFRMRSVGSAGVFGPKPVAYTASAYIAGHPTRVSQWLSAHRKQPATPVAFAEIPASASAAVTPDAEWVVAESY